MLKAMKSVRIGTASRAIDLLATHFGVDQTHFDRIVKDPAYRRQVGLAMTGKLVSTIMSRDEWIERESNIHMRLKELGLRSATRTKIDRVYDLYYYGPKRLELGFDHRLIPHGLTRDTLVQAFAEVGIPWSGELPVGSCGEDIPTSSYIVNCDLTTVMQPADDDHRPFMLTYDEQVVWSKSQGLSGIASVEEAMYILLRMKIEFGRILFPSGSIRCRNQGSTVDDSLYFHFSAKRGIHDMFLAKGYIDPNLGCIPLSYPKDN